MNKKQLNNQKGVTSILLAVIVVVVVAAIGVVVWKMRDNSGTKLSTGISKETQDKCAAEVNDKTFCKFAGVFANIGDYTATITSTDPKGTTIVELANDSKGNSSMVIKQSGQEQGNIIVYGGVTYLKDNTDGAWFKYEATDANKPETVDLKKEFVKSDFKGDNGQKLEYKKIGNEKCDNLDCFKYQVIDPQKTTETDFLWFDTNDYLLRRIAVNDSSTNTKTEMSISYQKVTISVPSPTKEFPKFDIPEQQ